MSAISYFFSLDQFQSFHTAFRAKARTRTLTSTDIVLYNLIRGLPADRGFSAIKNTNKLSNGSKPWDALDAAKQQLRYTIKRNPSALRATYSSITDDQLTTIDGKL